MSKTLIAVAAAALAAALAPAAQAGFAVPSLKAQSVVVKAECDEDFAENRDEDDEGYAARRASVRQQSQASVERAVAEPSPASARSAADAADTKSDKKDALAQPKKADPSEPKKSESKSVATAEPGNCKKYFSSVGMTLSVPCE